MEHTGNGRVQLAYVHENSVSHSWHESLRRLVEYDRAHGGRLADKPLNIRCNTGRLVQSRNFATKLFLDNTDAEWLWWCDTDMGFEPDALERLLQAANPAEAPVVGGLAFALMERAFDSMGGLRFQIVPTMYMMGTTADGHASFCFYGPYPDDTVVQVAGTGAAFLLIHRSVLEKVRAEHGDKWFDQFADDRGDVIGEDLSLCLRLGAMGIPIFVHTGVKTSHHKEVWIAEDDYLQRPLVAMEGEDPTPDLPMQVHLAASLASLGDNAESLASLAHNEHVRPDGILKLHADQARYEAIIEATRPEVIVETGTYTGESARWFARTGGCEVVTVDVNQPNAAGHPMAQSGSKPTVYWVAGSSTDPEVAARVAELVDGRRCMVVLDSDHSAAHVAKEIDLYGPLVTPGCYLVVEDTIFGYAPQALRDRHIPGQQGTPLDAVAEKLVDNPAWSRDIAIERTAPVSHHPAGWWLKVDADADSLGASAAHDTTRADRTPRTAEEGLGRVGDRRAEASVPAVDAAAGNG